MYLDSRKLVDCIGYRRLKYETMPLVPLYPNLYLPWTFHVLEMFDLKEKQFNQQFRLLTGVEEAS
jgi:phage pi2 protein 07